jgi:hypothetical protein
MVDTGAVFALETEVPDVPVVPGERVGRCVDIVAWLDLSGLCERQWRGSW